MSSLALAQPMARRMLLRMAMESSLFQSCRISRSRYASPFCPVGIVSAPTTASWQQMTLNAHDRACYLRRQFHAFIHLHTEMSSTLKVKGLYIEWPYTLTLNCKHAGRSA